MRKLLVILAIIALAYGQASDDHVVAVIYDTCDLTQSSYELYSNRVDNLDDFPYEIKAIYFQTKGKLTFFEEDDAQGREFVVDHDLECIEEGQVSWQDPQALFFIKHNEKLRNKQSKKSLRQKQETIKA